MAREARRILMITDNYPHEERPHITPFFSDHAKVLRRIGEVKVITLIRTRGFGYRRYVWEGVPVEALMMPYVPRMGLIFLPLALLMHTALLLKNLLTFKPDAVVVHMALPAGIPPAVFLRKGFLLVEHSSRFVGGINGLLSRFVMQNASDVLVVSKFFKREIELNLGIKGCDLLPNPVFGCENPPPPPLAKSALFVGAITGGKDPILLREAARLLPDFRFRFVGSGSDRPYLKRFLANMPPNCEYIGPLPKSEVLKAMQNSDILVSTSKYETFGVALAEALSCGRPVVWTDSGGPRDFLNEKNSVKVVERTPEAVARAIREAYERLKNGYFKPTEIRESILGYASPERVAKLYEDYIFKKNKKSR